MTYAFKNTYFSAVLDVLAKIEQTQMPALERTEGYADTVLMRHTFQPHDILFIFSNSGRNPAGGDAHNARLEEKYQGRIKHLK